MKITGVIRRYGIFPHSFMHERIYELGEEIDTRIARVGRVKFIQSTHKGFNFLIIEKNKVLFNRPLYDRSFSHREIPSNAKQFKVLIPDWATRLGL